MKLADETREVFEELEGMYAKLFTGMGLDSGFIGNLDDDNVLMLRDCMRLLDRTKNYSIEMAAKLDKIDSIDEKLDKLLEMQDKA